LGKEPRLKLPQKDLELIEEFRRAFLDWDMPKVERLVDIIDRQSKALEKAMERISEETTSIQTASIMIEIQALLNGDVE
jgi:hypothetical protein